MISQDRHNNCIIAARLDFRDSVVVFVGKALLVRAERFRDQGFVLFGVYALCC